MPDASGPSPRQSQQHSEEDEPLISDHSAEGEGVIVINSRRFGSTSNPNIYLPIRLCQSVLCSSALAGLKPFQNLPASEFSLEQRRTIIFSALISAFGTQLLVTTRVRTYMEGRAELCLGSLREVNLKYEEHSNLLSVITLKQREVRVYFYAVTILLTPTLLSTPFSYPLASLPLVSVV